VKICIGYNDRQGRPAPLPIDAEDYEGLVPVYEAVPGWKESTLGVQKLEDLPVNARAYIRRIETVVGAPIDIISTGPDRVETIILRHPFA